MKRIAVSTASAALLQVLSAQPALANADLDRFAASIYTYCDAVILGDHWGESVGEAKSTIGRKIGWGNAAVVAENISDARYNGIRCDFSDTGYGFDDAEALARMWNVSIAEAKTALVDKVSLGMHTTAQDAVNAARTSQQARRPTAPPATQPTARPPTTPVAPPPTKPAARSDMDYYVDSKYEYCDAAILGLYWRKSAYDAKTLIGRKLGSGRASSLEADINAARRRGMRCQFSQTGYFDEDARLLSKYLEVSIEEAERTLVDSVSMGDRDGANRLLNDASTAGKRNR